MEILYIIILLLFESEIPASTSVASEAVFSKVLFNQYSASGDEKTLAWLKNVALVSVNSNWTRSI